ncbi:DUF4249 domain-containing protein [Maribacter sp. 4G9]|uniref:DUF4249 domain-containing protein n=1 Tax=Maribacter sp. 4G9 TaxID=1889777 RepID=UPI000C15E452|nr:DUF4249 domain-containing protein [Maribacter sp. 4G9]PIB38980.1 hypothetical protein BFP75_13795 [Maribacter sp. 4G9]
MLTKYYRIKRFIPLLYLFPLLFFSCIDPVAPEYDFVDGLIVIEGLASSSAGTSYVTINRTSSEFGLIKNIFQEGATVSFNNLNTGDIVPLQEQADIYVPPLDFAVTTGQSWEINVTLADGTSYRSFPETVLAPVPISDISATFESELQFREASESFVPGHSLSVSFTDPLDEKNYYFWRFRSFENLFICKVCTGSILRDGFCIDDSRTRFVAPYFTYQCDEECWTIRYNESIEIFDDEFTNGNTVNSLPIANVLLYTKEDILVYVDQLSLSFDAFQYYKRLKDVVDNNGNFDAPPPAAVVGNIYNVNDEDEIVLGRFTATSTSSASIFIDRTDILDNEIDPEPPISVEPSPPFDPNVTIAPCVEGRFRTSIEPEGWIEN